MIPHQYVERHSGRICEEKLFGDRAVRVLYSVAREYASPLFRALTGPRFSRWLAALQYDSPLTRVAGGRNFMESSGLDWNECVAPREELSTMREVFERQVRYWECRPIPLDPSVVVSPADSRVIVGSLQESSSLFLKEKFFHFEELLGSDKRKWLHNFVDGDFAIFRLTPEKYHYNHTPVAGVVLDHYTIDGAYHSCNPAAVVALATPYSKNRRVVTIIDTDVPGGTGVGLVAMLEVVALMIGEVVQCYSDRRYDEPKDLEPGMFVRRGQPKSLFRPGSSTDVLLFQKGRVRFDADLVSNLGKTEVSSRFTSAYGHAMVETELEVRSSVARRIS